MHRITPLLAIVALFCFWVLEENLMQQYEVVVVGGGMVGGAAALGFAQLGFHVALVESHPPALNVSCRIPELRVSAIGVGSVDLLQKLQIWQHVEGVRINPFSKVEVWEDGSTIRGRFSSSQLGTPFLGYNLENSLLREAIWRRLPLYEQIDCYAPDRVGALRAAAYGWQLDLDGGGKIVTKLLVGADGHSSTVRQKAGISLAEKRYPQSCLLACVHGAQPQPDLNWQCFFPTGPRAYLSLGGGWGSLAWYDTPERIRELASMGLPELNSALQRAYPSSLGEVEVQVAGGFTLARCRASEFCLDGLVLLGDAAHTLHPMVGQGVNLALRDLAELLHLVELLRRRGVLNYRKELLLEYQRRRKVDNYIMQGGVEVIYQAFMSSSAPVRFLRRAALLATDKLPPLQKALLRYSSGLF